MSHGPHLREMSIYHFFHLHTTKAATVEARKRDEKACLAPTAVSFFSPSILPSRFTTRSLSPLSQKYSTCRSSFDGSTEKLQLNFNMQCAYSLTFYWAQQSLSESLWPCRYSDQGRVLRKQNMHCFLTTPNTIYLSSPRLLEKVACQSNEYIHHALNGATFERTVLFWIVFFFVILFWYWNIKADSFLSVRVVWRVSAGRGPLLACELERLFQPDKSVFALLTNSKRHMENSD